MLFRSTIIELARESADALLVLEYIDVADVNVHVRSPIYGAIDSTRQGMTSALYTYTLFDTATGRTVLSYTPLLGFSLMTSLLAEQRVLADAAIQSKVKHEVTREGSSTRIAVEHTLGEAQLVDLLLAQILQGFSPLPARELEKEYGETRFGMWESKGLADFLPAKE